MGGKEKLPYMILTWPVGNPGQNSGAAEGTEKVSPCILYCSAQITLLPPKPHSSWDVWATAAWPQQQFMWVQWRQDFRAKTLSRITLTENSIQGLSVTFFLWEECSPKKSFNICQYLKVFNVRKNLMTEQPLPGLPCSHFQIKPVYLVF